MVKKYVYVSFILDYSIKEYFHRLYRSSVINKSEDTVKLLWARLNFETGFGTRSLVPSTSCDCRYVVPLVVPYLVDNLRGVLANSFEDEGEFIGSEIVPLLYSRVSVWLKINGSEIYSRVDLWSEGLSVLFWSRLCECPLVSGLFRLGVGVQDWEDTSFNLKFPFCLLYWRVKSSRRTDPRPEYVSFHH